MMTNLVENEAGGYEDEIEALCAHVPEVASHFTITSKIGEGSFSSVYLAKLKHYPEVIEMFALKHIIPTTHPSRIENELRCLLNIGGQDNVMGVKLCLRNRDHVVVVMPVFPHEKFQEYLHQMELDDARDYMKNLLIALRRVHQFHVIHRDVKPSNFLYNRILKQYALVDFGLSSGAFLIDRESEKLGKNLPKVSVTSSSSAATVDVRIPLSPSKKNMHKTNSANMQGAQNSGAGKSKKLSSSSSSSKLLASDKNGLCDCFSKPMICSLCAARNNQMAPRAGTAGFRSPEMLMKSPDQTTAVDIWAAGVIFLSIMSGRYPFFRAQDDLGHLSQIISLLGSKVCIEAAMTFGKVLTLSENIPASDLKNVCMKLRLSQMSYKLGPLNQRNRVIQSWTDLSDEPFDLLFKMLDPNPYTRITAEEALKHPFFRTCDS
uniref:non-specific serine/threonine protein kinase n=1 Tax=Arion vulgaris TaxID=1028688 RepID=A0A0B6Z043_9EUPU